jgi:hypothetical protein
MHARFPGMYVLLTNGDIILEGFMEFLWAHGMSSEDVYTTVVPMIYGVWYDQCICVSCDSCHSCKYTSGGTKLHAGAAGCQIFQLNS